MVTKLFVPERRIVVPKPPSYLKLDMAFAIGAGAKLMDKSRYRSHATISGADWADGAHGRCLDFVPASNDYIEIPAAYTQLNFTTQDFSIIMRFKVDDLTDTRGLFARGGYNSDGYYLTLETTGNLYIRTSQTGQGQATRSTPGDITTGSWFTVGISRDGASIKPYINGIVDTYSLGTHTNPQTSAKDAVIGAYYTKTDYSFDGKVEFLRIFGGIALSASAHLAWHNALA